MADDMDVDPPATGSAKNTKDDVKDKKRFEVKKVLVRSLLIISLLTLFSGTPWRCGLGVRTLTLVLLSKSYTRTDIVVDNCAICRNHIMDLCAFFLATR